MNIERNKEKLLNKFMEISKIPFKSELSKIKERITGRERYFSIEQAGIITESYRANQNKSRVLNRALGLKASLEKIEISIEPDELIPGNRTKGIRDGVVFPEAGIEWVKNEIDTLPYREQDRFLVKPEDREYFLNEIVPFWKGKSLEEYIENEIGTEISKTARVVKINQKDHAQGHIIPNVVQWLKYGPSGLKTRTLELLDKEKIEAKREFYESVILVLDGAIEFIKRYSDLAFSMGGESETHKDNLTAIGKICNKLTSKPPETFREAVQATWFLFVILQMESNASSFSPGRMDQYLYPFFKKEIDSGSLTLEGALELIESLFLNFNKIIYMRNSDGARYFAGFPIGFNISIGGKITGEEGEEDGVNALTYLILKAQEHLGLPQPNLTARMHEKSSHEYIDTCSRVIGMGSGMPQIVNDESIIPALIRVGISPDDARDYGLVGCVELSTPGNNLGWSDAAMFNLVKTLELTLNNGTCMITGDQTGIDTGNITNYSTFEELETAYMQQLNYYIKKMMRAVEFVDRAHALYMPSPFLSSVIEDCIGKGLDVTAGGAKYNLSGIQSIQPANLADSLAVIKDLVYDKKSISPDVLLSALKNNWKDNEELRFTAMSHVPKYGNDVEWVDKLGSKWCEFFAGRLDEFTNIRGGKYHMGLYTVSAHVPMGKNVAASPDGRKSGSPLADGGVSPTYGQDKNGPTAVLKSVSRMNFSMASNGTLLNMKFLPSFFKNDADREKFNSFLKVFIRLKIHHIQFNVVRREDLVKARENPDAYRGLTIRVAGYTAYFTELAGDLQQEIIERTSHQIA